MKKIRQVVIVCITLAIIICLAGCNQEIEKDSDDYAKIWYNSECISIYSRVDTCLEIQVTVEYDEKTITVVKELKLQKFENQIINVEEINCKLFDKNCKIVSAEIIDQTYCNNIIWTIVMISLIIIYIIVVIREIKKDICKKR